MEFLSGIKQSLYTAGFLQSLASLNLLERILPNLNIDTQDIGKIGNLKNAKVVLQGEEIGKALKSGTTQHYRTSLQQTMQNT